MSEPLTHVQTVGGTAIHTTKDRMVEMRDGVHLCTDVYRPPESEPVPALLSIAPYNKELSSPAMAEEVGTQPAWSPTWCGPAEAGDTPYFVANDYAHVIASPRGVALSEGAPDEMVNPDDLSDLIEWIANREWCTGKIGMSGISAFGGWQFLAAEAQPPSLEAIFPYDTRALHPFRDRFPGGVLHTFMLHVANFSAVHQVPEPPDLAGERRKRWEEALDNPEYKQHPALYNVLTLKGMKSPDLFEWMLDPYDDDQQWARLSERVAKINDADIPIYLGTGWYAYTYKRHLRGNFRWNEHLEGDTKMLLTGLAHLERPQHQLAAETVRWYDHWLKGEDTGIMDEPFGRMRIMGADTDVHFDEWPLPETEWTDFYLHTWDRLREEPLKDHSYESHPEPSVFTQEPATQTRDIERLRFTTDPLPTDTLVVGPSSLTIHAAIDREDTTWIATLKDVGPDPSVQTAEQGWERRYGSPAEWERPAVHERELTRGWLKASHRAIDEEKSRPGRPYHRHTREACEPVEPGSIEEYNVEILPTANLFKEGHRLCLEITSLDLPTGVGGATDVEYIPWHVCHPETTTHEVYHTAEYPSRLTLPIIPEPEQYLDERRVE